MELQKYKMKKNIHFQSNLLNVGLCFDINGIVTKDIKKVTCTRCKKLYIIFKDNLEEVWCYNKIELDDKIKMLNMPY